jgi:putative peptidoglycan lipid II flippase
LLICIPATAGLIVLASPLVVSIYYLGAFTPDDVTMTTAALMAFSAGLPAFALVKVLAPGFYARQDTRTPVRIGIQAMAANIVLSFLLAWPLRHVGLALAISLAAFVNAAMLYRRLRRDGVYTPLPGWTLFLARIAGATLLMAILLASFAGAPEIWLAATSGERILRLGFWVIMGVVTYVAMLLILGVRPHELRMARPRAP